MQFAFVKQILKAELKEHVFAFLGVSFICKSCKHYMIAANGSIKLTPEKTFKANDAYFSPQHSFTATLMHMCSKQEKKN